MINPYAIGGAVVLGLAIGGGGAWHIQGLRLDTVKAEYKGFVTKVDAAGQAAKVQAERITAADKLNKEKADNEHKIAIDQLTADIERLRNARASRGYVPPAPAGSGRPDLACFDRGSIEQALRQFDAEVNGLIAEGDENTLALKIARTWAKNSRSDP